MMLAILVPAAIVVPLFADAAPPVDSLAVPLPTTQIYGGGETEQCGWPSVAYLSTNGGACTATLVHPQIILTAAHCVPNDETATIRFGERASSAVQLAETEYCRSNPAWSDTGEGNDYGFCKLATPVTNIPVTPIAFGCEETILGPGTQVTHVGYGNDQDGNSGRKKFVELNVQAVTNVGEIITGSGGEGICSGDSGGPVMVKLRSAQGGDDTWRVIGIHSWAQMSNPGVCGGTAGSVIASSAIDFIESQSGIDVTPCFDADGTWQPTWGCQGFPIDPQTGGEGSYNGGCETGPLAGFSEVCGNPLTDYPDTDPPSLKVVSPVGNQMFEVDGGGQAELHIEAEADDGDGWGVANLELIIAPEDGDMVTQMLDWAPYRWNTTFPAGGYNLRLVATDNAGNVTQSDWIAIGVGVAAPENPPGEDTTGGSDGTGADATGDAGTSDGGESNDTGDDAAPADPPADGGEGAQGCGCATSPVRVRDLVALPMVLMMSMFARARRRLRTAT
ncbi:MAG: trypsin-like serine protease [Deltaproteobacteria bacterium]|nr:trypsin-like serine protease [Deltaproteobacteria bacterium]MBK8238716.1 trypsin-like serine protease [Deltaproteobacteria bacterium]MBK8715597.1 trypsin-like serine protease [Deltaproteobacteria bacterium]MBP7287199.1 trypsin-like serine protease [Nannocystaceae bacterium]